MLWVCFSLGYASVGQYMAVLLMEFWPETSLTAMLETLPAVGAAGG